ncbi:hypothetical protein [Francisella philomiragia]|uniref:hypothetical protein n=1 Tax=Francisella philomiragia TaxID=28110 RepID=UPI00190614A3|nr:hypothetical protein [Francisella philomiragia]MBK2270179.1 hypothetical protein [Francisella philomiragia]MBK2275843.1 hypothetical protein [Francisella philomiragia]MBK2305056.1 hypothetical protein [Francisella philomiragia]
MIKGFLLVYFVLAFVEFVLKRGLGIEEYVSVFSFIKTKIIFFFSILILFMYISSFIDKEALETISEDNTINFTILGVLAFVGFLSVANCLTIFINGFIDLLTNLTENAYKFFSKRNKKLAYCSSDGEIVDLRKIKTKLYISKSSAGKGVSPFHIIK